MDKQVLLLTECTWSGLTQDTDYSMPSACGINVSSLLLAPCHYYSLPVAARQEITVGMSDGIRAILTHPNLYHVQCLLPDFVTSCHILKRINEFYGNTFGGCIIIIHRICQKPSVADSETAKMPINFSRKPKMELWCSNKLIEPLHTNLCLSGVKYLFHLHYQSLQFVTSTGHFPLQRLFFHLLSCASDH